MSEIRNFQQLWDATIECFDNGDYDTDAMTNVYNRMNPKLTISDLAAVFSGVYADTYWAVNQMDSSIMAKSLVQSIGLEYNLALQYSQSAMSTWRGTLVRKNINDVGQIPVNGNYTASLDIVCNENTPINTDTLITQWNNEFWKQPVVGRNYVYTRVQNRWFQGDLMPKVQMFYTSGGFNQPPSSWLQLLTTNGSPEGVVNTLGGNPSEMGDGVRGASEAFMFNPTSTDHVCIISAVVTKYFEKNNPLTINNNWDSSKWITHNGAAAWHNVNPQTESVTALKIYNQDGAAEKFAFTAHLQNVPANFKIGIHGDESLIGLNTGIHSVSNNSQTLRCEVILPPHYSGEIYVEIAGPNGELLPPNSAVRIDCQWMVGPGHTRFADAAELNGDLNSFLRGKPIGLNVGSYTLRGGN